MGRGTESVEGDLRAVLHETPTTAAVTAPTQTTKPKPSARLREAPHERS